MDLVAGDSVRGCGLGGLRRGWGCRRSRSWRGWCRDGGEHGLDVASEVGVVGAGLVEVGGSVGWIEGEDVVEEVEESSAAVGGGCSDAGLEAFEGSGLGVGGEEGMDLPAQPRVVGAGAIDERLTLGRRTLERGAQNRLYAMPPIHSR